MRFLPSPVQESAMKKSIGDNMIPKDWTFERGLELVKKAGYDGIELWLGEVPWFQMSTTDAQVCELLLCLAKTLVLSSDPEFIH